MFKWSTSVVEIGFFFCICLRLHLVMRAVEENTSSWLGLMIGLSFIGHLHIMIYNV